MNKTFLVVISCQLSNETSFLRVWTLVGSDLFMRCLDVMTVQMSFATTSNIFTGLASEVIIFGRLRFHMFGQIIPSFLNFEIGVFFDVPLD